LFLRYNENKTGNVLKRNIEAPTFNHCCSGKSIFWACICRLRCL